MSRKIIALIIAMVLTVGGVLAIAFGNTKGPEPALVCAAEGKPTSGFVDEKQDDCPIDIASWNRYADWLGEPQPVRAVGVIATLAGLLTGGVVGITALVQVTRRRSSRAQSASGTSGLNR